MNGRQRIIAMIDGEPVDRLPVMPLTMMFAADQIGEPYGKYAADSRVLVEGQIRTAEKFDFDYVSVISDPARAESGEHPPRGTSESTSRRILEAGVYSLAKSSSTFH